jgi:hypothetical protein
MSSNLILVPEAARASLVRQALRIEWFTAAWMVIEAAVTIGSGVAAHSLSLVAFGADSVIAHQPACCYGAQCRDAPWRGLP